MTIVSWWGASVLFGLGFYPLGALLFRSFADRGWLFSKALGIAAGGYLVFLAGRFSLLPFRSSVCIGITLAAACLCWLLFRIFASEEMKKLPDVKLILREEFLFLLVFFFWSWCSGFRPEAFGTEKPMDYGFMAAMMRSEEIPARDIWYSQGTINYYYGGQFYAVYLTKLTLTRVNETYHLMRALVAAFCFNLSFSLVRQALKDRDADGTVAEAGGLFAGLCVSFAGNVHYLLYGLFGSVFQLAGWESYWFPASTRYIGHNPVTEDSCIHEFPSYSFVLGDLHAHVTNLFLVLLFIGLMYAWLQYSKEDVKKAGTGAGHLLAAGILIGIFKWTNYWDFIIYYTVFLFTAAVIAFRIGCQDKDQDQEDFRSQTLSRKILTFLLLAAAAAGLQAAASWPFTSQFDSMFQGVALAQHHTPLYQFLILWGLPLAVSLLLAAAVVRKNMHRTDLFFILLAVSGIGLILIPELVYVRDIYEEGYARSNTMFKLTYQAYVMLGLMMSYTIFRLLFLQNKKTFRIPAAVCAAVVLLTFGYGGYAVSCWYGNILDPSGFQGLDATAYLESEYPEDAAAIRYLDSIAEGQQTVLEAPGDSYSRYCRVSSMTGLPTLEGWYVHEWLWRNDPENLNLIQQDILQIYTGTDPDYIQRLLEEYEIDYIFIGSCEREAYGDELNEELLRSLGTVCYDGREEGITDGAVVIQLAD